ncbi:MAG: ribosome recycling factor family protein [Colwellia sp.]|nr:ribosome recycling factor family protein [Colwellia sp.]MCW8865572.1 ribosome recycling factor family protein [Colwellia sp.]MCW9082067.1 ribosome recycling factor family protein [Colwellia sp.]
MLNKINTITLPSFLRKAMKAYALKALIRQQGCELHRIGRSRNWQLKASFEQIQAIIEHIELANEPSWCWLAKLLQKEYQHLSHDELVSIASRLEKVTLSALIAKTDCTIAQARKVIDELEGLD